MEFKILLFITLLLLNSIIYILFNYIKSINKFLYITLIIIVVLFYIVGIIMNYCSLNISHKLVTLPSVVLIFANLIFYFFYKVFKLIINESNIKENKFDFFLKIINFGRLRLLFIFATVSQFVNIFLL